MSKLPLNFCLRPETPEDEGFLARLFASTRTAELSSLVGGAAAWETFLRIQLRARRASHAARYPDAEGSIVLVSGQAAGRLLVDRTGRDVVLVDIALLPEHRSRGLGRTLVSALLSEAGRGGRAVKLHVLRSSRAARFYERLGFVRTGGDEVHDAMEWRAPSRPLGAHLRAR